MPTSTAATSNQEAEKRRNGETGKRRCGVIVSHSPILPFSVSIRSSLQPLPSDIGFTLLELTVVLFIIGLLIVAIVPRFGDITGARLNTSARRLAAVVRYLSGEAALRNRPYQLHYDLDKQEYWVTALVPTQDSAEFKFDSSPLSRPVQLPPAVTFADVQTPGVGRVSTGRVSTYFHPQGYADPTVIHLRDQRARAVTILIPSLTGEARVYEGYVDGFVRR